MTEVNESKTIHIPVMLNEIIEYLRPKNGDIFVDGTIGLGGHSQVILKMLGKQGRLIGLDRDQKALALAKEKLEPFSSQSEFIYSNFINIDEVLDNLEISAVDGILLDLGVSSLQLDDPQRGFSLRVDGPLDMRMDQNAHISAYDLVNSLSEKEIVSILKDFGQERWAYRIARKIVENRVKNPIETTRDLRHIIMRAMPFKRKRERKHPAIRSFQAFRIAVNRELEALEIALDKCIRYLKPYGRIGIVSFHSLEDKIVKEKFRSCSKEGKLKLVVKKPLRPSEDEVAKNSRSKSARLRIAERI